MRWRIRRQKYPADPDRPWIAYPGRSIMRGRRFPTHADALAWVVTRTRRRRNRR